LNFYFCVAGSQNIGWLLYTDNLIETLDGAGFFQDMGLKQSNAPPRQHNNTTVDSTDSIKNLNKGHTHKINTSLIKDGTWFAFNGDKQASSSVLHEISAFL